MHSTTNFLLVNLAVSDCLTLLAWPLHWQIWWREKRLYGITGDLLCKTFTGVTIIDILCVVSSFTLTTLAIERYHALMKPFHTSLRLSIEYVKPQIGIIWFSSILLCLPDFILRSLDNEFNSWVGPWTMHMDNRSRIYVICNLVLSVYVPFFILLFCYSSVIRGLYFTNTVCASEPIEHSQSNQEKKQLVITFVSVTAGFFCLFYSTWEPIHVFSLHRARSRCHNARDVLSIPVVCANGHFNPKPNPICFPQYKL